jgi:signal transduction histidine kinase
LKFKSLKTKILFWFAFVTVIILLLFNFAIYHFLEVNTKLNIQNSLYNKAVFINNKIMDSIAVNDLIKEEKLEGVEVAIIRDDKIIFKKGDVRFLEFIPYKDKKENFFVFNRGDDLDGLYILRISNPFKGAILFYEKEVNKKINQDLQNIKKILLVLEPILLLVLILLASKLIDKILRNIKSITDTANKIYVTDLSQTIPQPKYDDEIKDLVDSFNAMLGRLQDGVQTLERFNSDVSHELKTPLTVIKGEIEITLNKERDSKYYENSLKTIEYETNQIQEIVDNLLLLTKYSNENISQTFEATHIESIVLDVIDHYESIAKQKNIKIEIAKVDPILKDVNPALIRSAFSNIVDNSIKYSLENTSVSISLYERKGKVNFIVQDHGLGIPKDKISNLTDRFFRVDSSRNKKIKGFGLGLSIVQKAIDLHNGKIKIRSAEGEGTTVKIIF